MVDGDVINCRRVIEIGISAQRAREGRIFFFCRRISEDFVAYAALERRMPWKRDVRSLCHCVRVLEYEDLRGELRHQDDEKS